LLFNQSFSVIYAII